MNVKEITIAYLKEHGYDGLVADFRECGCGIEDLACCEETCDSCEPGYKVPCTCGEGCAYHVTAKKPEDRVETTRDRLVANIEVQKGHWRDCIARGATGQATLEAERIGELMARLFVMDEEGK